MQHHRATTTTDRTNAHRMQTVGGQKIGPQTIVAAGGCRQLATRTCRTDGRMRAPSSRARRAPRRSCSRRCAFRTMFVTTDFALTTNDLPVTPRRSSVRSRPTSFVLELFAWRSKCVHDGVDRVCSAHARRSAKHLPIAAHSCCMRHRRTRCQTVVVKQHHRATTTTDRTSAHHMQIVCSQMVWAPTMSDAARFRPLSTSKHSESDHHARCDRPSRHEKNEHALSWIWSNHEKSNEMRCQHARHKSHPRRCLF